MATRAPFRQMAFHGLVALVALCLAYLSWSDARFAYLRVAHSAIAHAANPSDAVALRKVVDARLRDSRSQTISDRDLRLAREAVVASPLSRGMFRIAGMGAAAKGDAKRAATAMTLSSTVSRRDAVAQIWLIQKAARENDVRNATFHYHAVLSVHPELGPALYPILARAISFPEIRVALTPYIERGAAWSADFLKVAASKGDPRDVALLVIPAGSKLRGEAFRPSTTRVIARLIQDGDFALAIQMAKSVIPSLDRNALSAIAVNAATTDERIGPLAWEFAEDGRILASPNGLGGFDVDVAPLARGTVAARAIGLVGGRTYDFTQTLKAESDVPATFRWQAFCLPIKQRTPVWQQLLPQHRGTLRYETSIPVPLECKGIQLILSVLGPEGQHGAQQSFEAFDLKSRMN